MNKTKKLVRRVTTRDMYKSLTGSLYDCPENFDNCVGLLRALVNGKMETIREEFKSGMTTFLCPNLISDVELLEEKEITVEVEIHVYHNGKRIGVLVDSEVSM